jgi:hypothetical protein
MEKSILTMKNEKRIFNYIVLALLTAAIASWIVLYPK